MIFSVLLSAVAVRAQLGGSGQVGGLGGRPGNIGGQQDEGGCYTGAGFQYCAKLDACHRSWELLAEEGQYGGMSWEDVCDDSDEQPTLVGGERDDNGCIGSAGYSWCEARSECVRPWLLDGTFEENCNTNQGGGGPLCGPVCMIFCEHGNVMDARGCPTCRCNPGPSPCLNNVVCSNQCSNGFVTDDSGCSTCECQCPALKCRPVPGCRSYAVDDEGCQTCQCADEVELPYCDDLNVFQRYCNSLESCRRVCQCPANTKLAVENEGTRSSAATCRRKSTTTEWCPNSPFQVCRMMCREPQCGANQCAMRQGRCCDYNCQAVAAECEAGEEYDNQTNECVAVSCEASPCEANETCVDEQRACIRSPCPQYTCTETRITYSAYKKGCNALKRSGDGDACNAAGCIFKKNKCRAQKQNKFSCKKVKDETFCREHAPDFCSWNQGKCKGGKGAF